MKKYISATLVYVIISMILGMAWHFVFFKELYDSLGIYNRTEPIIPLGLTSMLVQGLIMAHLYPRWYRNGQPIVEGIKFGLFMGAFLFSVSTLANGAKIQVNSMSTWLAIQTEFHLVQFTLFGAGIGWVYGRVRE
jgi:hypothetical protein